MRILAGLLAATGLLLAADLDRTKPPQTPAIPDVRVANVHRFELPNGLVVVTAADDRFPLTTFRLAFKAGSKLDPVELPGLADTTAALLNQGTTTRSAAEIARMAANLGGEIGASSDPDTLTVMGSCLSPNFGEFLKLLAEVARSSSFPPDEVELQKQNALQTLRRSRSQADYVGREMMYSVLFGSNPYSHIGPTEAALGKLSRQDVVKFRDTYLAPNNAYLVIAGRLPESSRLHELVTAAFGDWARGNVPPQPAQPVPGNQKRLLLVDRPGSVQANVFAAHIAPTYGTPEMFPVSLGNQVLGGSAISRLFTDIREAKSFAYDAHSEFTLMKDSGITVGVTQVRNEVVEPALAAVNQDLAALSSADVQPGELSDAKNVYAGRFILRLERQSALADQLVRIQTMGLPQNYLDTYMTHVRSVEPDQIRKVAQYWDPSTATLIIVGDAQKIQKALAQFGTVEVRKPIQ